MCSQIKCWWRMIFLVGLLFPAAGRAGVNVLTYHNDNARTGQNTNETVLTPENVASGNFRKMFTQPVDGYVYAQPLVVTGVTIPGQGVHDVVYVATEHNSVYAFDANSSGDPLWQVSFINPAAGITTVPSDDMNCGDVVPEIGITSTPVIDAASGTIYVCAKTREVINNVVTYAHRLHALDLGTGAEKFGGPVLVQASVTGTGDGTDDGRVAFDAKTHFNRAALLLSRGVVYMAFASHCDVDPYHGWIIGYGAQTLTLSSVFNATPNGKQGGIWQSGGGPATDAGGNIYAITGNGSFDNSTSVKSYGNTFLRLSTTNGLKLIDYFTPYNQENLSLNDSDLGSGGPLVLPNEAGSSADPRLVIGGSKDGAVYLINRDRMQHYNPTNNDAIVQVFGGVGSSFSTPAYFNKRIYFIGRRDSLKAFTLTNALIQATPDSQATNVFGFPGATPCISANGTNDAIVWALQTEGATRGTAEVLRAYDASNVAVELYNSSAAGSRDVPGTSVKFAVPTVANGRVFVGAQYSLSVYGVINFLATPVITPASGNFANSVSVTISGGGSGATIYYTLDGSTPTTGSTLYTGAFTISESANIRARAFQAGAQDSDVADVWLAVTQPGPDGTAPRLQITAPVSGQRWSNAVFTVAGKAADNQLVAGVFVNLNSTDWVSATTGNNWSNWTAQVALTPGTNFISAYSVDAAGNQSAISTVKLVYIFSAPLQVTVNGSGGSIAPNLNNALLQVGANYTMTAVPKTGFAFAAWTDGQGNLVTNRPAVKFIMSSALALTANFADITKPTVSITNLPGGNISNELFTVKGRAGDNVAVADVFYNLNNTGWSPATTGNNWTNWSALLDLTPGTNFLSVSAVDATGNTTVNATIRLVYVVSAPLTVTTTGNGGSIAPSYHNALLQLGANYAMTATAKAGFAFTNWTDGYGSLITNKPSLKFQMVPGLVLAANFVDITRPTVTITNLPAGSVTNEFFTLKGRAGDNAAVQNVFFNLNSTGWSPATTGNNWTNWSALLDLAPGTNTLAVSVTDATGNSSAPTVVKIFYLVTTPLTIGLTGKGNVSPSVNGALLAVGRNYPLTATAGTGFVFTNWTDGTGAVVTNRPTLTFKMAPGLSLMANFVDVSRPTLAVYAPTSSASVTKESLAAGGRAADNAAVAGVRYQLNGGGWYAPSTTNGWTNWNVTLSLTPGTNYFAAYATDTSGNFSATNSVKFVYYTAPASLSGLKATTTYGSILAFGPGTFVQSRVNGANGVGNYTYTRLTPGSGRMQLAHVAPPTMTNLPPETFNLTFAVPNLAQTFYNGQVAGMTFTSTPSLVQPSVLNQAVVRVDTLGQGNGTLYTAGKYVSVNLLTRATNTGTSYSYTAYGPLGALLKQSGTNGTTYSILTYQNTNAGAAYLESYGPAGNLNGTTYGVFGFSSQRPGGNAPDTVAGRSALVTTAGDSFKLKFDTASFVQLNPVDDADIDGAGSYVYARTGTNTASLYLNFIAPPESSAASFRFYAPNFAVFTNNDGTMGGALFK